MPFEMATPDGQLISEPDYNSSFTLRTLVSSLTNVAQVANDVWNPAVHPVEVNDRLRDQDSFVNGEELRETRLRLEHPATVYYLTEKAVFQLTAQLSPGLIRAYFIFRPLLTRASMDEC